MEWATDVGIPVISQLLALFVILNLFNISADLIAKGHDVAGVSGIITAIAGLVSAFIYSRKWLSGKRREEPSPAEPKDQPAARPDAGSQ